MYKYIFAISLLLVLGLGCSSSIQNQSDNSTDNTAANPLDKIENTSDKNADTNSNSLIINTMQLTSPAFQNEGTIPAKYTCDGLDINPPLIISYVPKGTKSFALIVDDPDAPAGTWVHWVVWNIDPAIGTIAENSQPGVEGLTSSGETKWGGPCPPSGVHRYYFSAYALDVMLQDGVKETVDAKSLRNMMDGHILESAELMGRYGS